MIRTAGTFLMALLGVLPFGGGHAASAFDASVKAVDLCLDAPFGRQVVTEEAITIEAMRDLPNAAAPMKAEKIHVIGENDCFWPVTLPEGSFAPDEISSAMMAFIEADQSHEKTQCARGASGKTLARWAECSAGVKHADGNRNTFAHRATLVPGTLTGFEIEPVLKSNRGAHAQLFQGVGK